MNPPRSPLPHLFFSHNSPFFSPLPLFSPPSPPLLPPSSLDRYDSADGDEDGCIDVREFLLGLNNFSGAARESKCAFTFEMYDEDKNGFLCEDELIGILKANHMVKDASDVMKKCKTIMRQCDEDGDGHIDRDEFSIVAEKVRAESFAGNFRRELRRELQGAAGAAICVCVCRYNGCVYPHCVKL